MNPIDFRPRGERGVILFIALIVLVAMSLGGIALMRSVTGGLLATDNLRLQRSATISGDLGIERGRDLAFSGGNSDNPTRGYYASWNSNGAAFDPFTYEWDGKSTDAGTDNAGNQVSVVVHRMCELADRPTVAPGQKCLTANVGIGGSSKLDAAYGQLPMSGGSAPYYRVTARIKGPKNTTSYVQALLGM